jgi:DNA mismatch repair protein MutS2
VNHHALEVLEFQRALALVAERATSDLGREAVQGLSPSTDADRVRRELERVSAVMDFVQEKPAWGPPPVPDARGSLRRLQVEGSVLEPGELHGVGVLLRSSRELAREIDGRSGRYPPLATLRGRLVEARPVEDEIVRTVDAEGAVLDSASRELRRIREALRSAHTRIVRRLEAYLKTLPARYVVGDASVTVREGRYVIPLRREGRGEVGGIVHDESGTGATVFVEPPVAIELMNELRDLERDEHREIRRILRELSGRVHPLRDALLGALEALVDMDSLHARARAALAWGAEPPAILSSAAGPIRVVNARHPLLLAREERVVPYDLEMDEGERTLVVSGPNTGGKSVFLKAMGLLAALAQSGVVPPVGRGTALPVFTDVFADIGDEQSIAESLSTFSAHLENLKEIVGAADAGSLVLMDEMGTGTDPTEGAALARAILEELTARGAFSIVTSHLGALKTLADEGSGIVNASLQFDAERMEPTYRLTKGRPGRSYGLAIARRLGFPGPLLDRADGLVDEGAASLEELLERLEARERDVARLQERLERETAESARLQGELRERERELHERERGFERRAREDARQLLMEAREEVEEAIRSVKDAREEELEEAARSARRRVEEAARDQATRASRTRDRSTAASELAVGSRVRLPGAGATRGTVLELRDGRAVVEVRGVRMELPASELEAVESPHAGVGAAPGASAGGAPRTSPRGRGAASERRPAGESGGGAGERGDPEPPVLRERGWSGDLPEGRHEIDLRGLRVDEVELELGRGLDAALLSELAEVRIIHGKGTGAVRGRVEELLRGDRRVKAFRLGVHGEGGAGVTVARIG